MNGPGEPATLTIERVGAEGDGVARLPDGRLAYLAGTLPGERVTARLAPGAGGALRGTVVTVAAPSPDRVEAPCPHVGACGGCVLQHWAAGPALAWKVGLVTAALARAGFASPPAPAVHQVAPGTRRRMDLALSRAGGRVAVGLSPRHGHAVTDLHACLVLDPALFALLAPLRAMLSGLAALRRTGGAVANRLDTGVDLLLRLDAEPDAAGRRRLGDFASAADLARLSIAVANEPPETIARFRPAVTTFAGVAVEPPPGGFLQAAASGEAAIVAAVRAGLPDALPRRTWIADLYAGCGTLTFPLAGHARVAAFEGDAAAVGALRAAANAAQRAGRVGATQRDLARRPLLAAELAGCAAVVLDPPHAGASAQMPALAAAGVPRIAYVSCNPAALARDAAPFAAAGYRLIAVSVIDQFLWSARVESVCVFTRDGTRPA